MRCSRCENELPDSATVCSRCGTPIQTSVNPSFSGFSYLPVGAPPWPTTVPQRLTQSAASIATASALPAPKARKPLSNVLLTIFVLVLIPLLGAAVTFTTLYTQGKIGNSAASHAPTTGQQAIPTPTTQPGNQLPNPTSFKQISNADLNVSFKYPSNWNADAVQKASDASSFAQHISNQQFGIDFFFIHFEPSQSSKFNGANDLDQQTMESLQAALGVSSIQPTTAQNQQPQIAGTTWTEQDGTFQDNAGNTYRILTISVEYKNAYYNITSLIPQVYYTEAAQKYFQPMLDSIKFLS